MRRIEISPAAVAAGCVLFYLDPCGAFCPFVLAAALHEASHLLALGACGAGARRFRLGGMGAVLSHAPLPCAREVLCALAGPGMNAVCAFAFARSLPRFAAVSALLAAYNLLPVEPLDGGTALRALAEHHCGPLRGREIVRTVRAATLATLALAALWCSFGLHGGVWPLILCAALLARLPKQET